MRPAKKPAQSRRIRAGGAGLLGLLLLAQHLRVLEKLLAVVALDVAEVIVGLAELVAEAIGQVSPAILEF